MVVVFFVFRMRFYAAWCAAEASCISAGLGCYPEKSLSKPGGGPTVNYRYISKGLTGVIKQIVSNYSLNNIVLNSLFSWKYLFLFLFSPWWPVVILQLKRNMTTKPSRTLTATTRTSVWRSDKACVTGTWPCSGGYITISTLIPPSKPTLSGKAVCVVCSGASSCDLSYETASICMFSSYSVVLNRYLKDESAAGGSA